MIPAMLVLDIIPKFCLDSFYYSFKYYSVLPKKFYFRHSHMNMSILNFNEFFCKISAGITAFGWKTAAVNLSSEKKFYDNGASAVLVI